MILSAGTNSLCFRSWGKEEEMIHFLSNCGDGSILLGKDAEQISDFYAIRVASDWEEIKSFGVGIYSEGHGLEPHLLVQPERDKLIIGFNSEVIGIDTAKKKTEFQIKLNSLFRSFTFLKKYGMILVFHEIGMIAVNENGQEIWRFDGDIIENCVIDNNSLSLTFLDSDPVELDIFNGTSKTPSAAISH